MAFFFDTTIEQMFCKVGVRVEWWPTLTHPEVIPMLNRPSLFILSALPSSPRCERQLADLGMRELLTRTDYGGLVAFFRGVYDLDPPPDGTITEPHSPAPVEQLIRDIGGEVADLGGGYRPRVVPRAGRAPLFRIDTARSAQGRARQLRELLFVEIVSRYSHESVVQLYKDLYAWEPAEARRER